MDITISLGQVGIEAVDCARDLGVLLDSSLSMHQHMTRVTSTCFFQAQPHTRHRNQEATCLRSGIRITRVDHCNSALSGISDSTLAPLQRVGLLHAAARFVLDMRPRDHVTAVLQSCHSTGCRCASASRTGTSCAY